MFLHAWRLTLPHPITGEKMELEAPVPDELQRYMDSLEQVNG
jgi:23S rRNA pseudouridine955/2504/2580 synthase